MSNEPEPKPQPNVTTIYLTPYWRSLLAQVMEGAKIETASETFRVALAEKADRMGIPVEDARP